VTLRIEVLEDSTIEIMRPRIRDGNIRFLRIDSLEAAMRIIRFLLKREMERAKKDGWVSRLDRECRKELAKLVQEKR